MNNQKVIIVESPAKAKTISTYLNGVSVYSSKGHIRDIKISGIGGLGIDIDNDFEPDYEVIQGKGALIKDLIKYTKDKEVFLATDPDREGEAIAWHLTQVLNLDPNKVKRVIFKEITKSAVKDAFEHPQMLDLKLVESQETRRILDRIIGFKLSALLRKKNVGNPTAGRVQSVALKLICDLEEKIQAFVSVEYYNIFAHFEHFKAEYIIKKDHRVSQEEAQTIHDQSTNPFTVTKIDKKETFSYPRLPFITSTLQQEAFNTLSMGAARVSRIAQDLYEGIQIGNEIIGLITYMRTDSTRMASDFVSATNYYISNNFGRQYLGKYKVGKNDNAQDAHEAIRPTSVERTPEKMKAYLTDDQYKVYKKIYERAVASLMAPAIYDSTKVILSSNGHNYALDGSIMKFEGYHKVLADTSKDKILPDLNEGEVYNASKIEMVQKFTQPPARYNEASLIKELEAKGIGRPSTYSSIIQTLKDDKRGYVALENRKFIPTDTGIHISKQLNDYFNTIINDVYTAQMEDQLDHIADGQTSKHKMLNDFYTKFEDLITVAQNNMLKPTPEVSEYYCPKCGAIMYKRPSKYKKGEYYLSCSNFPKCKNILPFPPKTA